jgi:hypothetical protein
LTHSMTAPSMLKTGKSFVVRPCSSVLHFQREK